MENSATLLTYVETQKNTIIKMSYPMTIATPCPVCGKPASITPCKMFLGTPPEVETLHITGCDCLDVFIEASLPSIFQGLQDDKRSLLRGLPSYFCKMALQGKPISFSREEFLRLVDDKENQRIEQQKRKRGE